jgi:hypothetical protein
VSEGLLKYWSEDGFDSELICDELLSILVRLDFLDYDEFHTHEAITAKYRIKTRKAKYGD